MKKLLVFISFAIACLLLNDVAFGQVNNVPAPVPTDTTTHTLQLPPGFSADVVAEGMMGARHMAATPQGGLYVKLSKLRDGKGILYLKDSNGDGKFEIQASFGDYPGTGIYIKNGYLYASSNDDVYRYKLNKNSEVMDPGAPEKIVVGLVNRIRDNSKAIVVDNKNNLYVNVGSYLTSCLVDPASKQAPYPCPLLDSVGGIWQFKPDRPNQQYKDGIRYATGFKNTVGLTWNTATNSLFLMNHGRDQLHDLFPQYYSAEQNAMLPSEVMYEVKKGADGGWPYIYYDHLQKKKILMPEYGGDGKKTGGENTTDPIVAFPAHLAPNGLLFYTGNTFPARFKNGAFVAFHAKSAELQKGYFVAFVPFKNGKPSGKWEYFAENFAAGTDIHKPCGLAQAADGSIFVSDDAKGMIYRIRYDKKM
jgi:glucose/arabinose dehydrogenase